MMLLIKECCRANSCIYTEITRQNNCTQVKSIQLFCMTSDL